MSDSVFLFIMGQEVVEESMNSIGSVSEIKEWKISVCSQPAVWLHARDFPKHKQIK